MVPGELEYPGDLGSGCSLVSSAKEMDSPKLNRYLLFLNNSSFSFFYKKAARALYKQIENKDESDGYFSGKSPRCLPHYFLGYFKIKYVIRERHTVLAAGERIDLDYIYNDS